MLDLRSHACMRTTRLDLTQHSRNVETQDNIIPMNDTMQLLAVKASNMLR